MKFAATVCKKGFWNSTFAKHVSNDGTCYGFRGLFRDRYNLGGSSEEVDSKQYITISSFA